jgi:hypothetical protein
MASEQSISALLGTQIDAQYSIPRVGRRNDVIVDPTQIGDGLAGPLNVQHLVIYRDPRPIAADELAFQKSLGMEVIARHRAGRYFFLTPEFQVGGAGLDAELPGMPLQGGQGPTPWQPGQLAGQHYGIRPTEVLPPAQTVMYTATPQVGYDW